MRLSRNNHLALIITLGLVVLGSAVGQRFPWHIDEVRFAGIALEMLQRGDWLVPHRAAEIYADKPPIFFWMLASVFKITGSVRWGFLIPGVLAGIGTLLLVYDLGARWWNRKTGFIAALLLLSSYQFWRITTSAHIDSVLVFMTTLGLYGFVRHLKTGRDAHWFYAGFLAVAIGILSKGVGFLPLLVFIPFALAHYHNRDVARIPPAHWLIGITILFATLLCWLIPLLLLADSNAEIRSYLDNILLRQTAQRYANAWQHREPWWFFLANIPKYWAPVSLIMPFAAYSWYRHIRRHDTRYTLLLGWAIMVVLFFSLSTGKRELYILPALPAVALAITPAFAVLMQKLWMQRTATVITMLLIVVFAGVGVVRIFDVLPHSRIASWPVSAGWALLAMAAFNVCLAYFLRRKANPVVIAFGTYVTLILFYHQILVPMLDNTMSGKPAMRALSENAQNADLALIQWDERNWLYSHAPLQHNGKGTNAMQNLCSSSEIPYRWVMSKALAEQLGINAEQTFELKRKKPFVVVAPQPNLVTCDSSEKFRYQFAWDELSLRMIDR